MANLSNINNKFLVTTGGNVLIGATADVATVRLHVKNPDAAAVLRLTGGNDSWDFDTDYTAHKLLIKSNGAAGTVMTLLGGASGNVGIGDTSPQGKLEVNNRNTATGAALFIKGGEDDLDPVAGQYTGLAFGYGGGDIYNNGAILWEFTNTAANGKLHFAVNPTGGDGTANLSDSKMTILDSGDVGIGTTSPGVPLHVVRTTAGQALRLQQTGSNVYTEMQFQTPTGNMYIFVNSSGYNSYGGANATNFYTSNGAFAFHSNAGNNHLYIANGGNIGIGTTGPSDKLTIKTAGSAQVETGLRLVNPYGFASAGTGTKLVFAQDRSDSENYEMASLQSRQSAGGTSSYGDLSFYTRNSALTEKMRITYAGGISFGTTGTAFGTSGQVLISNGNTSPTWGSATSVSEDNYWKIDDGLNFHLAFKEGSGTTVADISGGRNNFTGTATWTETGKFGYALDFNGTNQNLGGTSPSSNITTFSAWINNDGGGGIQNIVSGTYIMAYVSIYSNNFQIYDGTAWRNAGAVPLNEWVHVAFSYDASGTSGGLQKMYINGVLGYSATAAGYTGVASYISHVGVFSGAIRYFNGEITNIQTWDRILGDSEILSLYNQYSGVGGNVSEASLWTVKAVQSNVLINGNISLNDLTHTYTFNGPHALYISGGFTTTPVTVGQTYSAHMSVYVDGNLVALVDQHDTPPEWWRQGFAFMTPNYTSGQHTITVTGLNQNGNFNVIGTTQYSQIVYRIIPL